jgi:Tol biopolymer transport system component
MTPGDRFVDLSPEDFDRRLAAWFEADARTREPEGLLEATLTRTGRARRLPTWLLPERWLPMQLTSRLQPVPSIAGVLLVLGLILALALAAVLVGSQRSRLAPFGPAANGRIAFVTEGDIYAANPDGTDPVAVTAGADIDGRPVWSHVGSKVAFLRWSSPAARTADLMVLDVDAGTLGPVAVGAVNVSVPSWSPDDRFLTFSHGESAQVYVAPADGSTEAQALELGGPAEAPIFSPDGRRLAYTAPTSGGQALFVANLDGTGREQLSTAYPSFSHGFGHGAMGFAWSPDGSSILFSAGDREPEESNVYVVASDGSAPEQPVTSERGIEYGATWSPDGKRIAYLASAPSTHPNLMVANADGSDSKQLIDQTVFWLTPQWSPDGTMIIVHANIAEEPPIWLIDSVNGAVQAKLAMAPAPGSEDGTPGSADIWSFERVLP